MIPESIALLQCMYCDFFVAVFGSGHLNQIIYGKSENQIFSLPQCLLSFLFVFVIVVGYLCVQGQAEA